MRPSRIEYSINTNVGKQIRLRRTVFGLSAVELAKRTGLNPITIYNYENSKTMPNIGTLTQLASIFQCRPVDLLDSQATIDLNALPDREQ